MAPRRRRRAPPMRCGLATTATGPAAGAGRTAAPPTKAPAGTTGNPGRRVTMADARNCPVTIGHPVPRSAPWRDLLFGSASAYGNGKLWVGALWPHGVV